MLNGRVTREQREIRAGEQYYLRITGLNDLASTALTAAFLTAPPTTWTIADHTFTVVKICCNAEEDPWSGQTSYENLAATQLHATIPQPRTITLLFHSPTAFQSKEMHIPIPLPSLVFGSLADRWNLFSPVTISPDIRRFGEEMVAISHYKLQSAPVAQKGGGLAIGGIGQVTYRALSSDRYWLAVFHMLADFALYSGAGVKTTIGMGQVRRVT